MAAALQALLPASHVLSVDTKLRMIRLQFSAHAKAL